MLIITTLNTITKTTVSEGDLTVNFQTNGIIKMLDPCTILKCRSQHKEPTIHNIDSTNQPVASPPNATVASEERRIKGNEAVKARRLRYLNQGLCGCGRERKQGLNAYGKPELRCERCINVQKKKGRVHKPKPPKQSNHDQFYRVIKTGEIGKLIPCPSTDPIILKFKDGLRDAFHLRELEPTLIPSSNSKGRGIPPANRRADGRPKGIPQQTIDKMLAVYRFLQKQSSPVYRGAIEKEIGHCCARALMHQQSQPKRDTLESMGIVKRTQGYRTWALWELTQRGRKQGKELILNLNVH